MHLGSTQELIRLLRSTSTSRSRVSPSGLSRLRERLLAMGTEHQALVQAHAGLLERLLRLLEEEAS